METIRFDKADVFSRESTHDEWIQEAMDDSSDIASIVSETIHKIPLSEMKEQHAGDVHGAMGPVGLYIYTMEDDDWIYIAHFIYEVEYQCFLFRHRKQINEDRQGETFGVTESAIYYDEDGM